MPRGQSASGQNIGCEENVVYESPEDGLIKTETYVRVDE
jgi:hypothetical protein